MSSSENVDDEKSLPGTDETKGSQVDRQEEAVPATASAASIITAETKRPLSAAQSFDIDYDKYTDVHKGFPRKLFIVLGMEEYNEIISWLPHGRGFIIKDRERLTNVILPEHFKKAKFQAFTRKLNRWNFTRIASGPERGAYYHPFFQRDNRRLSNQMSCIAGKRPQAMQSFNPVSLGMTAPMMMPFSQQPIQIQPMPQNFLIPPQAFLMNQMFWMQQQQQQQQQQTQHNAMPPILPSPTLTPTQQQPSIPEQPPPPSPLPTFPDDTDTSTTLQRTQWDSNSTSLDDRQDNDTIASVFTTVGGSTKEGESLSDIENDSVFRDSSEQAWIKGATT